MVQSVPHPTTRDLGRRPGPADLLARPPARVRDYARTTLRPRHRAVVQAFAEALFAHDAAPEPRLDGFPDEVDAMISNASKTLRFGLCVMLDIVRWAPLFIVGRFSTFEGLRLPDRVRMLEKMERGPALQLIFIAYKTVLTMLYLETPEELRALGYSSVRLRHARVLPQHAEAAR